MRDVLQYRFREVITLNLQDNITISTNNDYRWQHCCEQTHRVDHDIDRSCAEHLAQQKLAHTTNRKLFDDLGNASVNTEPGALTH